MYAQKEDMRTTPHTHSNEAATGSTLVENFRARFPHFFTPKIEEHRNKSVRSHSATGTKHKADSIFMKRKLERNQTGFIGLEKIKGSRMQFFCDRSMQKWAIEAFVLLRIINMNHPTVVKTEWVGIKIGSEVLTVNRSQLVCAIRYFKL